MKKLFYCALALLAAMAVSCNKDLGPIEGTSWEIVSYGDYFSGSMVYSAPTGGSVNFYNYESELVAEVYLPEWSTASSMNYPEDYRIVRRTRDELVLDLWYYDYPPGEIYEEDCIQFDMFKGRRVYRLNVYDIHGNFDGYYLLYFKPDGTAVELAVAVDDRDLEYYYDTMRVTCRRIYE